MGGRVKYISQAESSDLSSLPQLYKYFNYNSNYYL